MSSLWLIPLAYVVALAVDVFASHLRHTDPWSPQS